MKYINDKSGTFIFDLVYELANFHSTKATERPVE
jgi:hypothetical protein